MGRAMIRLSVLVVVAVVIGACGTEEDKKKSPPVVPTVLLSDDFSSGTLSNWTVTPGGGGTSSATTGNPAPSMHMVGGEKAFSNTSFDLTAGLTVSFDCITGFPGVGGFTYFGGVNSGTSGSPGLGAVIFVNPYNQVLACYLNGILVYTFSLPVSTPTWSNFAVKILPNGIVKYYRDSVLIYTSTSPINFTSPRSILLYPQVTGDLFVDNVVVTTP